jgi:hypothetical protein
MIPATDTNTLVSVHVHFSLFLPADQITDLEVSLLILTIINFGNLVRLDVLPAVTMKNNISGMRCHVVGGCIANTLLAACLAYSSTLQIGVCSSAMSVNFHQTMRHHVPEDSTLGTYFDRLARTTAILGSQMNISISICLSMVLQPFVGPWPLFQFLDLLHGQQDSLDGGSARHKATTCTQDSRNPE